MASIRSLVTTSVTLASILIFLLLRTASEVEGCSSSDEHDEYRVVRKTDAGGKQLLVAVDEDARMYCQTNAKWKRCIWKPPRNGVREVNRSKSIWP